MRQQDHGPVLLFGYDSSPFTNKIRLALRLKGIPFSYIPVPSMLPRPLLTQTFALPYRKIPILAFGREIYCDTSLIIEALEHFFPATQGWGTVYPASEGPSPWNYRRLARGFASFWTDRPLFRTTTGLLPPSVWASPFAQDRAQLIGHPLDPAKLAAKIPINLSALDAHLSLLEPTFTNTTASWIFPTTTPSLADIALYYQLRWAMDISAGKGVYNLTGGNAQDAHDEDDAAADMMGAVFNSERYPGLWAWFARLEKHLASLPDLATPIDPQASTAWKVALRATPLLDDTHLLVPTAAAQHSALDAQRGLLPGALVSVVPEDTGRDDPTVGVLVGIGVEEVVVRPVEGGEVDVRIHFPRVGFVVRVVEARL